MRNDEIAEMFEQVATFLRILEDNPFHARAYDKAARVIRGTSESFTKMIENDVDIAKKYRGIGSSISDHIREIAETGKLSKLQDLMEKVPAGLLDITKIRGIGPKTARSVWKKGYIETISELEEAAKTNQLRKISGIGPKTEEKIVKGIEDYKNWEKRILLSETDAIVDELSEYLKKNEAIERFEVAGSWRRRKQTVGDLDVLAISDQNTEVMDYFTSWNKVESIESTGKTKSVIIIADDFRIDFRLLAPKSFGAALCYFTGSKAHNIHLRTIANDRNLTISEYGVFKLPSDSKKSDKSEKQWIAGKQEEDVYKTLDLKWIPPELREDKGEVEASANGKLPNLITLDDIKGDLQMHSNRTDGNNAMEEMIRGCISKGYQYMAITDHTQSVGVTGGLDTEEIKKQISDIGSFNDEYDEIEILAGLEVDILEDGSLDTDSEILQDLDIVLGSIHSKFELDRSDQTERVLKALNNPHIDVYSHPTGRIINKRDPINVDFEPLFQAAEDNHVIIECNSQPDRLDLDDVNLKRLKDFDVYVSINTDAHTVGQLDFMKYGINQARRGWIEPNKVINAQNFSTLNEYLKK